jgi:dTDP-4-dehydrorhamnose 3,5-epimerase
MRIEKTSLPGVLILEPTVVEDHRGYLFESYSKERAATAGIDCDFVQINQSRSRVGVVRGIHYQLHRPQAKLVRALRGSIFDVAVDLRRGSPGFGRWTSAVLSAENRRQLFIPEGFGHAFCALDECEVLYQLSSGYSPGNERGLAWDDPTIGITWPVTDPLLSVKDMRLPRLSQLPPHELPQLAAEKVIPRWNETSFAQS